MGIAVTGEYTTGVVFPIAACNLFTRIGSGWTMRALGLFQLVLCIIGNAIISNGITPEGDAARCLRSRPPGHEEDRAGRPVYAAHGGVLLRRTRPKYPVHIPPHLRRPKGRPSLSYVLHPLGDERREHRRPPRPRRARRRRQSLQHRALLTGLLALVFWMFADTLAPIIVFSVFYGIFTGAYAAMQIPCVAQISDIGEVGTRIGIFWSAMSFAFLAGGPAAGAVLKVGDGKYTGMIVFCGVVVIFGALLIFASRYKLNRNVLARV